MKPNPILKKSSQKTTDTTSSCEPILKRIEAMIWIFVYLLCTYGCTKIGRNQEPQQMALTSPATELASGTSDLTVSGTDFTIALLPDTQGYLSDFAGCTTNGCTGTLADQKKYLGVLSSQINYLIANKTSLNLKYVAGLGDIVEHSDSLPPGYQQLLQGQWTTNEGEWRKAYFGEWALDRTKPINGIDALRRNNIPFGLAVGNHDMFPHLDLVSGPNNDRWDGRQGVPSQSTTIFYNKYFGKDSINHQRCRWYGGSYDNTNNNHWDTITVNGPTGDEHFIFIYIQFNKSSTDMALVRTKWMDSLLGIYKDYHAAIITHAMVGTGGSFSAQGRLLVDVAKKYGNVFLMAGGHFYIDEQHGAFETVKDTTVVSATGKVHTIRGMTADYQGRDPLNGNGLLRLLKISLRSDDITVRTYSPYTNTYESDINSQFTIPLFHRAPIAEIPDGKYAIYNLRSKKAVSVEDASMNDGAPIMQRTWAGSWTNQMWNISQVGTSGYYKFLNVNSSKALVVKDSSTYPKDSCVQWSYYSTGSGHDEWGLIYTGEDSAGYRLYRLIARHSGLTMQVENASQAEHAIIRQNDYHKYRNELFYFERLQ